MADPESLSLASQDKVLIEKDGQFELVNTAEVQAEVSVPAIKTEEGDIPPDPSIKNEKHSINGEAKETPVDASEPVLPETKPTIDTPPQLPPEDVPKVESNTNNEEEDLPETATTNTNQLIEEKRTETLQQDEAKNVVDKTQTTTEQETKTETVTKEDSEAQLEQEEETETNIRPDESETKSMTDNVKPLLDTSISGTKSQAIEKLPSSSLTSSATTRPMSSRRSSGHRLGKNKLHGRLKSKKMSSAPSRRKDSERALLNERAFQLWVEKKNAELQEKRQKTKTESGETEDEKLRRNQRAFESWLRKKQKQLLAQRMAEELAKPENKAIEEEKKEKEREMFTSWLQKKSEEKAKLKQMEEAKKKEMNILVKKTPQDVAQKAYKQLV